MRSKTLPIGQHDRLNMYRFCAPNDLYFRDIPNSELQKVALYWHIHAETVDKAAETFFKYHRWPVVLVRRCSGLYDQLEVKRPQKGEESWHSKKWLGFIAEEDEDASLFVKRIEIDENGRQSWSYDEYYGETYADNGEVWC